MDEKLAVEYKSEITQILGQLSESGKIVAADIDGLVKSSMDAIDDAMKYGKMYKTDTVSPAAVYVALRRSGVKVTVDCVSNVAGLPSSAILSRVTAIERCYKRPRNAAVVTIAAIPTPKSTIDVKPDEVSTADVKPAVVNPPVIAPVVTGHAVPVKKATVKGKEKPVESDAIGKAIKSVIDDAVDRKIAACGIAGSASTSDLERIERAISGLDAKFDALSSLLKSMVENAAPAARAPAGLLPFQRAEVEAMAAGVSKAGDPPAIVTPAMVASDIVDPVQATAGIGIREKSIGFFMIDLNHMYNYCENKADGSSVEDMFKTFVRVVSADSPSEVFGYLYVSSHLKMRGYYARNTLNDMLFKTGVTVRRGGFHVFVMDNRKGFTSFGARKFQDSDVFIIGKACDVFSDHGSELKRFYLVSGDVDTLPAVQRAKRSGVPIKVISFEDALSGVIEREVGRENVTPII